MGNWGIGFIITDNLSLVVVVVVLVFFFPPFGWCWRARVRLVWDGMVWYGVRVGM